MKVFIYKEKGGGFLEVRRQRKMLTTTTIAATPRS